MNALAHVRIITHIFDKKFQFSGPRATVEEIIRPQANKSLKHHFVFVKEVHFFQLFHKIAKKQLPDREQKWSCL